MRQAPDIDPLRCPGCGEANGCAVATGSPIADCWCWQAPPSGLVASGGQQCYCATCLAARAGAAAELAHAR
jgi:hypothetical protein